MQYSPFDPATLRHISQQHELPVFVYSAHHLEERAAELAGLQLPYGYVPRYAVKANAHPTVIEIFQKAGLGFDASSSYEAQRLLDAGVSGETISLSSQQPAHNLDELLKAGVRYVATSMRQLELYAETATKGSRVGLRVNPGLGAGHNNRTTTGGANSSFGLWAAYVPEALLFARSHQLTIDRLHVHIGSGADPKMWGTVMETALEIVEKLPDVSSLNIGGGFKIHRYSDEHESDMSAIVEEFSSHLTSFAARTGREIQLELEPGTWLVGHAGVLLASVVDIVDTGEDGHQFLRLNTGMNDIIRPSMYGAQHDMAVLNDASEQREYVVVGHNCETGDILTPAPGDPEGLEPRPLNAASIGDTIAIYDAGAYCASFRATGYNSYPDAGEIVA